MEAHYLDFKTGWTRTLGNYYHLLSSVNWIGYWEFEKIDPAVCTTRTLYRSPLPPPSKCVGWSRLTSTLQPACGGFNASWAWIKLGLFVLQGTDWCVVNPPGPDSYLIELCKCKKCKCVNVNVTDTILWQGHHDRVMQLNWLYFCGKCQMMPLKVWPNTALGCNHQSICMLQPLCSAALVPNVLPRRDEGSGEPCAVIKA